MADRKNNRQSSQIGTSTMAITYNFTPSSQTVAPFFSLYSYSIVGHPQFPSPFDGILCCEEKTFRAMNAIKVVALIQHLAVDPHFSFSFLTFLWL